MDAGMQVLESFRDGATVLLIVFGPLRIWPAEWTAIYRPGLIGSALAERRRNKVT
jgi:hypothetical protein